MHIKLVAAEDTEVKITLGSPDLAKPLRKVRFKSVQTPVKQIMIDLI
jgi:hypothetical protein